jgi:hypothetical protein
MNPTGPDQTTPGQQTPASKNNAAGEVRDRLQPITPRRQADPGSVNREVASEKEKESDVSLEGDEADTRPESSHAGYTDSQMGGMICDDGCLLEPSGD